MVEACALSDSPAFRLFSSCDLNKAFHIWSRKDRFSPTFVNNVLSHTEKEHSAPAWMLLAKVAGASPALDHATVIEAWERMSRFALLSRGCHRTRGSPGHRACVLRKWALS